jgi:two-component system, chemotaxis family, chemotaxis protein CheY
MHTVLLIDDDDLLRGVLTIALERRGYTVFEASDGKQGVDIARAAAIDIVITDLIMPVQEGVETIITLRRECPRLPIIAMSGGATNSNLYLDIAGKIGAKRMLPKPFSPKMLVELIEQVLAEEAQTSAGS